MFPQNPKSSSISITSISPTLISLTHSLKRQARRRGGQRWLIDVKYPPLSREEFAPIWAFSIAQQGQFKTFEYIPEIYNATSGTATGSIIADGTYTAGDSIISTTGLTGTLKAGDFIKFDGHDKVYMITIDGSTTLNIEPALIADVADLEAITYNDVPFKMAFTGDITNMSVAVNQYVSYNLKLVEIV
jgi:hypothetical protein